MKLKGDRGRLLRSKVFGGMGLAALILGLTLASAVSSRAAQEGGRPKTSEERLEKNMTELKERLALTEEQEVQVRALYGAYYEKLQAGRSERGGRSSAERKAYREERGKLRDELEIQLATVLTPEQMEKWKKYQEERREEMRKKRPERREEGGDSPDES